MYLCEKFIYIKRFCFTSKMDGIGNHKRSIKRQKEVPKMTERKENRKQGKGKRKGKGKK